MNSYKEIKFLYQSSIAFFYFIVYESILNVFNISVGISTVTLVLSIVSVFSMDYLMGKMKKKYFAFFIPVLLSIAVLYIYYQDVYKLYNIIVVLFNVVIINKSSEEFLNYDYYISEIKKKIQILLLVDTIVLISHYATSINYDKNGLIRLSIVFLILAVVLLRAGRNFSNGINNSRTRKFNIAIVAFAFLISIHTVSEKLFMLLKLIFKGLGIGFEYFYVFLMKFIFWPIINYVLSPLFDLLSRVFKKFFGGTKSNISIKVPNAIKQQKPDKIKAPHEIVLSPTVEKIIFVIIICLILYIAYILYNKVNTNKKLLDDDVLEEREIISNSKDGKKKKSFVKTIMDLFKNQSNNEKVRTVYKAFEKDAFKKGIFKKYMTATRLRNVSSAFIDSKEELKDITDIYNEAKFSEHHIADETVSSARQDYNKIKKEF